MLFNKSFFHLYLGIILFLGLNGCSSSKKIDWSVMDVHDDLQITGKGNSTNYYQPASDLIALVEKNRQTKNEETVSPASKNNKSVLFNPILTAVNNVKKTPLHEKNMAKKKTGKINRVSENLAIKQFNNKKRKRIERKNQKKQIRLAGTHRNKPKLSNSKNDKTKVQKKQKASKYKPRKNWFMYFGNWSLLFGILAISFLFFLAIPAIIFGIVSLLRNESTRKAAITGLTLGGIIVLLALSVLMILFQFGNFQLPFP